MLARFITLLGSIRPWLTLVLAIALAPAHAHLMLAQKGTLNVVGDSAYLVLSVPVSAFSGIDDDGDGMLSPNELHHHAAAIEDQVRAGARLHDGAAALRLEGVMLSLSQPDDAPAPEARQLLVMGRYAVSTPAAALRFEFTLFGRSADEHAMDISFTQKPVARTARFTAGQPVHSLFPTAGRVFTDQLQAGATHVLSGLDHLLFLLVVLASMAGARHTWRHVLLALSCFTAGHGLTLAACAWGGLSMPPAIVEPAIAATIVCMPLFDRWKRRQANQPSHLVQLTLVFGCALIHGLGLAGAMDSSVTDGSNAIWSLAGFNLGIELAQVGVATTVAIGAAALARLAGPSSPLHAARAGSLVAMLAGSWWFVERAAWAV